MQIIQEPKKVALRNKRHFEEKKWRVCSMFKKFSEYILKLILEWVPAERRKRGCPRKTWMEGVHAAMTARNIEQNQWRNREEWCLVSGRLRQLS
jgi:hypothetical protein